MNRPWHAIVCSALARHLRVPAEGFDPAQRLREDWGLRPLDLVTVAIELEDAAGVDFPIAGLHEARTVGDLAALLSGSPEQRPGERWGERSRVVRRQASARAGVSAEG